VFNVELCRICNGHTAGGIRNLNAEGIERTGSLNADGNLCVVRGFYKSASYTEADQIDILVIVLAFRYAGRINGVNNDFGIPLSKEPDVGV